MNAASLHEPGEVPNLRAFHVMTKPIGPICNLDCKYCFYLEKEKLFPANERFVMPDYVLEDYIRQHIQAQSSAEISFAWQGGEPTSMTQVFLNVSSGYSSFGSVARLKSLGSVSFAGVPNQSRVSS
jgi:sulfatase maturation enzyme AslB (radical SAM superfamily)